MSVAACRYRPLVPACEPQKTQMRCITPRVSELPCQVLCTATGPANACVSTHEHRSSLAPEEVARNDQALHFGGAFANAPHARFAIPALQRHLLGNTVTTVDLHG